MGTKYQLLPPNFEGFHQHLKLDFLTKQVKEQRMESEEDEDLTVQFDTRTVFKETPLIAMMK